jgi:hypothetical protein
LRKARLPPGIRDSRYERVDVDADILARGGECGGRPQRRVRGQRQSDADGDGRARGARSQFAQVVMAASSPWCLLFATGPLQYLPRCVLAGLVFTIAVG